jgi:hypothetical protein
MAANMWKNSLKNIENDKNKILYETLLDFLQRNGTYFRISFVAIASNCWQFHCDEVIPKVPKYILVYTVEGDKTTTFYACLSKYTLGTSVNIWIASIQTGTAIILIHHLEIGGSINESSNLQKDLFHFQSRRVTAGKVF